MKLTGHKTTAVYRRYRIVNEDDIERALAQTQAAIRQVLYRTRSPGHRKQGIAEYTLLHGNGQRLALRGDHKDNALVRFGLAGIPGHEHLPGSRAVGVTGL